MEQSNGAHTALICLIATYRWAFRRGLDCGQTGKVSKIGRSSAFGRDLDQKIVHFGVVGPVAWAPGAKGCYGLDNGLVMENSAAH